MSTIKQQALDKLGQYMDKATKPKRKEMLAFLEGFTYYAQAVESLKEQKNKPA